VTHLFNQHSVREQIYQSNQFDNKMYFKTVNYSPHFVAFLLHHSSGKSSSNCLQHIPLTNPEA